MVFQKEALLRRTESYDKSHVQSEADRSKNTRESMQMLGITVAIERMTRAAAVRWYGHVLEREKGNILKETWNFGITVEKKRKPKAT